MLSKMKGFQKLRLPAAAGVLGLGAMGAALTSARAAAAAVPMNITLTTAGTTPDIRWELNNAAAFAGMAGGMGVGDGVTWSANGSHNDPYDNAWSFTLNGTAYAAPMGQVDLTETADYAQITGGIQVLHGLDVTYQMTFFSSPGRLARFMPVFTNNGTDPITIDVRTGYNSGPGTAGVVDTASGDASFENTDQWFVARDSGGMGGQPHLLVWRFGKDADVQPTAVSPPGDFSGNYVDSYNITIPAGQTARLLVFHKMHPAADSAGAMLTATSFDTLDELEAGGLLTGLTSAELSQVVNYASAGLAVTETAGDTVVSEDGSSDGFDVVLTDAPDSDVILTVTSEDPGEVSAGPQTLTFTSANWSVPQTVTVTGVDDARDDGDQHTQVIVAVDAAQSDVAFGGAAPMSVTVTTTDDDTSGITVSPISQRVTSEDGSMDSFTVVLDTEPASEVFINLSSSDETEGTVSPIGLTFDSTNWDRPREVRITGVDDNLIDGAVPYSIVTAAASSLDGGYDGLDAADVAVSNSDDDHAGITVSPATGLMTAENGGSDTYTVVLDAQPMSEVTVKLASSDPTEGTVAPETLTFTSADWDQPQIVTVTGVDDAQVDGSQAFVITAGASSADMHFDGIVAKDVQVNNADDDQAGIIVSPTAGLVTTEAGGSDSFTVVLHAEPTAAVTIDLASSDTSEGTVAPAALSFTSANWNQPQIVMVTGVDDVQGDGDVDYTISLAAANSDDAAFHGVNPDDVAVRNTDDERLAELSVTMTDGRDSAVPGELVDYVILVANAGPDDVENVRVMDVMPESLTGVSWICDPAGGASCVASGSGDIYTFVDLPAGDEVVFTVTATIAGTPGQVIENRVNVSAPEKTIEKHLADNVATDETMVLEFIFADGFEASADLFSKAASLMYSHTPEAWLPVLVEAGPGFRIHWRFALGLEERTSVRGPDGQWAPADWTPQQ